jgi:hypothetical protein
MKPRSFLSALIVSFAFVYSFGDVIPENSHYVNKCVTITNLEDFSQITLIGYITGPIETPAYKITQAECLTKGYKFNTLYIYAVGNEYLNGKDISKLDFPNDFNAIKANCSINPYGGYIPDTDPTEKIEEYYKILGFTDTSVVLFKWKEIIGYNNGAADMVKTYDYEGDVSIFNQEIPAVNKQIFAVTGVKLFPNPANKNLNLQFDNAYRGYVNVDLFTIDGKLVLSNTYSKRSEQADYSIDVKDIQPGSYMIRFDFSDTVQTKRIIIE